MELATPPAPRETTMALLLGRIRSTRSLLRELFFVSSGVGPWCVKIELEYSKRGGPFNSPPLHEVEEAVGLLVLLHTLDHKAWAAMVASIWPQIDVQDLQDRDKEPIGVEIMVLGDVGVKKVQHSHEQRQTQGLSTEYHHILQSVKDTREGESDWAAPTVPVSLVVKHVMAVEALDFVSQTYDTYQANASVFKLIQATMPTCTLELGYYPVTMISVLYDRRLPVGFFGLGTCTVPCLPRYRLPVVKALRHLLVVSAIKTPSSSVCGANTLHIPPTARAHATMLQPTPSYWLPALFSAAHSSLSLGAIDVEAPFADLREDYRLEWLVYAALLRTKQLEKLKLNCCDIEMRDVAVVTEMIAAANPLQRLLGGSISITNEVVAARFWVCDPRTSPGSKRKMAYRPPKPLSVLVVDDIDAAIEWIRVLLPGQGEAWVHRSDAISVQPLPLKDRGFLLQPIPTIALENVTVASTSATLALLQVVHSGLHRLEVSLSRDFGVDEMDEWFQQVARICCDLKELEVHGTPVKNLGVFTSAFSANSLRLTQLKFVKPINCDGGHVLRFFQALSDPRSTFATSLTSLQIKVTADAVEMFDFNDTIVEMLTQNQRLKEFQIRFCLPRSLRIAKRYFNSTRDNNRDDTMAIPLDHKSKLAFLSVVSSGSEVCAAASRLNTNVLAMIFDFSSRFHKRKVKVEIVRV